MPKDDLSGKNLDSVSLSGDDMSESNLSRTSLRYSQLKGTRLRNTDLSESDLRGANLRRADVTGANLTNADLTDANVQGVDLESAGSLRGANLEGAVGVSGNLDLSLQGDVAPDAAEERAAGEDIHQLIAAVAELNGEIAVLARALHVHQRSVREGKAGTENTGMPLIQTIHRLRHHRDELEVHLVNALSAETDAF
jgi:hypothetical protein